MAKNHPQSDYSLKGRRCLNFVRVVLESFSRFLVPFFHSERPQYDRERKNTFLTLDLHNKKKHCPSLTLIPPILLCHSPSSLPVLILLILPAPGTASPAPRGETQQGELPRAQRAQTTLELNASGEWQPTVDLSLHQSVWVCEEHLFNMTQK